MIILIPQLVLKNHGFTLIESLTTIVIAGVLIAVAAPNLMLAYQKQQVNNASEQIELSLKEAQRFTMRQGQNCQVTLNSTNGEISSNNGCLLNNTTLHEQIVMETNITGTPTTIDFIYKGNISHQNTTVANDLGTIVLSSSNGVGNKKCIVITQTLGLIRSGVDEGSTSPIRSSNCNTDN